MLASASNAIIIGFNVKPEPKAMQQAQTERVDIKTYNVIYEAINDVKAALAGMLAPIIREVPLGKAQVRMLFPIKEVGTIAGCFLSEGKATRNAKLRVTRDGRAVGEGQVTSLKRFKDDAREVHPGAGVRHRGRQSRRSGRRRPGALHDGGGRADALAEERPDERPWSRSRSVSWSCTSARSTRSRASATSSAA